jgi:hypothetical protein
MRANLALDSFFAALIRQDVLFDVFSNTQRGLIDDRTPRILKLVFSQSAIVRLIDSISILQKKFWQDIHHYTQERAAPCH